MYDLYERMNDKFIRSVYRFSEWLASKRRKSA